MTRIHDMIVSHCQFPTTNQTRPSALTAFSVTERLGMLQFDLAEPVTIPRDTVYQIVRSVSTLANVSSAAVSTVVWEGNATQVILPADMRSYYWYAGRARTNSYFSPLLPNTFGIGARPWITPETMPGNRAYADGELNFASNSYWATFGLRPGHSISLAPTGGPVGERGVLTITAANSDTWSDGAGVAGQTRIHPLRYDVNSRGSYIAVPCFPGQSGSVMCVYRRNAAGMGASVRVAPVSVNSPKALSFGGQLVSQTINAVSATSGEWNVMVASFTMPTSTIYDAVTLYIRLTDNTQPPGVLEIGGLQLSTL